MTLRRRNLPNGKSILGLNRSETDYLREEIFEDRSYIFERASKLPSEPVIFDVGANIGVFSLFALEEWPNCRVFAFEPIPDIFRVLEMNLVSCPGVTLFNFALGGTAETREIVYYPNYTMMSGFDADVDVDRATVVQYVRNTTAEIPDPEVRAAVLENLDAALIGRFKQERIPVQVERISDVMARNALDRIDLLKVDVEGSELQVLQGVGDEVWPVIGSAVVEIADRAGELGSIEKLFRSKGMRTEVRQIQEYRETDLYIVFAER